jgi:hypothetical protein
VHERQTSGLIGPRNDLEAQKMLDAITSGDRSALTNLYMSYYAAIFANMRAAACGDIALEERLCRHMRADWFGIWWGQLQLMCN